MNQNLKIKREKVILRILDSMLKVRNKFYFQKKVSWKITREELLQMPDGSLGKELGRFLVSHNFLSIPTLERHDVFHLLFGYETHVIDEIAMLYFLVGNGKVTPFTTLSAFGASLFFPEHWVYFFRQFKKGRNAIGVSNWDFRPFLTENMEELREAIFLRQAPYSSVKSKMRKQLLKTSYHAI